MAEELLKKIGLAVSDPLKVEETVDGTVYNSMIGN